MPRAFVPEEVEVLRFFEEAPLEKAELLFNIVKEKMRGRLAGSGNTEAKKKRHPAGKETKVGVESESGGPSSPI